MHSIEIERVKRSWDVFVSLGTLEPEWRTTEVRE